MKQRIFYFKYEITNGLSLYAGGDKGSYVVNKQGEIVAKLNALNFPIVIDSQLFTYKGKELYIHDLSNLLTD